MKIILEKCPFCQKEFEADSEKMYWHIKIHSATNDCVSQKEIVIKPNVELTNPLPELGR